MNCLPASLPYLGESHADITDAVTAKIEASNRDGSLSWERSLEEVAECSVVVGGSLMPGQEFDGRLAIAARLTADLRGRVEHELDYTVSAGVSLLSADCCASHVMLCFLHNSRMHDRHRPSGGAVGCLFHQLPMYTCASVQYG